jgi:HD-like signal output (HDOD) protein
MSVDGEMMLDMPTDMVQEDPKGSSDHLENYLKIISESPMFPAFSANIQELLGILEDPYYPVFEVARVVLRDVSLTTQILKLVNSIYFQSRQRQVHTISSAVMIMGFELVRDLAVGLKLFENFQKSASLDKVKQLMFQSFFMALATQELACQDQRFEGEELFLTALLYNFGELAAAYYLPEEYHLMLDMV